MKVNIEITKSDSEVISFIKKNDSGFTLSPLQDRRLNSQLGDTVSIIALIISVPACIKTIIDILQHKKSKDSSESIKIINNNKVIIIVENDDFKSIEMKIKSLDD